MKKVLTVLLAIAVMFTFSFGSAFAATTYTSDDYDKALQEQKEKILGYLESYKTQAVNSYHYNNEKFATANDDVIAGFMAEAYAKAADAVIDKAEDAMDKVISEVLDEKATGITFPMDSAIENDYLETETTVTLIETDGSTSAVKVALEDLLSKDEMINSLEQMTEELEKTQAPLTKAAVEAKKDAIKLSEYNSEDKDYAYTAPTGTDVIGTVATGSECTAADAVSALIDDLEDAISDADKLTKKDLTGSVTDLNQAKRLAYEEAYEAFDSELSGIETLDDEAFNGIQNGTSLDAALNAYVEYGYNKLPDLQTLFPTSSTTISWETECKGAWKAFWEGKTKTSKDGELFGVAIANYQKVTRSEASAVYYAMKAEIDASKKVVQTWANTNKNNDVADLHTDETTFYQTLKNAMDAADTYADVVKYGEKLKARYDYGVKQYDDAKVEAAVKAAEEFVYGDINEAKFAEPVDYIEEAANDINDNTKGLSNLLLDEAKYAYDKFTDAVEKAAKKMYTDGVAALGATKDEVADGTVEVAQKVPFGADKTADEDLVYLLETYFTGSYDDQTEDWNDIAQDALEALVAAQTYEDIDAAMKTAADEFGKLLKKADKADVENAREAYKEAFEGFVASAYKLLDNESDYDQAYDKGNYTKLIAEAARLIDKANTVEAVKAAYADAQAVVAGVKSDAELKDMKKAVENKIKALPAKEKLTVADKAAVVEAYDAYVEYIDCIGAKEISNKANLTEKYNKVNELVAQEIEDAADALYEKMEEVNDYSDANMPKYLAYKEEAKALVAKGDALDDEIAAVNEDEYLGANALNAVSYGKDYAKIKAATCVDLYNEGDFYNTEIANAQALLIKATKPGATAADMQAGIDAYNALTQRQQYELDNNTGYYVELVKNITEELGGNVKALKITAKSTAKKGSITVTWTVKGDASQIDGYEVWKSTKQSKGYKKAFTTTKKTYKNTKNLKKGTRYYFKVRAYKVVDGVKLTSDWSNKAYRVAK